MKHSYRMHIIVILVSVLWIDLATALAQTGQPPAKAVTKSAVPSATQSTSQFTGQSAKAMPAAESVATRPAQAPKANAPANPGAPAMNGMPTESPVESILSEDLIRALRDPFQLPSILMAHKDTPRTDLEIFPLKDFHLNGVVTGPKKMRAMLTAPSNKVYFVKIGDKIGVREGTVTQITPDAIKVTEYFTDEHGKRIPDLFEMTMAGELVSLNKKEE